MHAPLTGGCQCGRVRYRLDGPLIEQVACACRMCQKANGSAFMPFAGVAPGDLTWTRGKPRWFSSSPIVRRGFCPRCGTPVAFAYQDRAAIYVTVGSLDDPDAAPPDALIHAERLWDWARDLTQIPWYVARSDAAPDFESFQHPDQNTERWKPKGG